MFTSGSANSGQLQIGIALVLQDRFSNQAREASSQIRRLHSEAKAATNANLNAVRTMATQGAAVGMAVSAGLWSAVKQGANFIDTMTQVGVIAKNDGVKVAELTELAQGLGKKTMFSSQDVASGMQYFAMAGMSTKEIANNIEAAANLAGATKHELGGKGGAADLMTNIMKMFKIDSTKINAARVSDLLTTGVTSSNMSLTDLAETVKYSGTTVKGLGASLEQTIALAGSLGNAGIQGSMAGTAIGASFRYLAKSLGNPEFKGGKALAKLGLGKEDLLDSEGGLLDMSTIMFKIANATNGMDKNQIFNSMIDIFGVRGQREAGVISSSIDEYRTLLDKIQTSSQGSAEDIMATRMGTIAGHLESVASTWENLQTTYTATVAPILSPIFKAITFVIEGIRQLISVPYLGTFITALVTIGTVLTTLSLGAIAMRASFRLMFNDSLVSARGMFAVMTQGWRSATFSAAQYGAMHNGIIAQQKAGILGNGRMAAGRAAVNTFSAMGMAKMQTNGVGNGQWVGNVRQTQGGYFWARNANGGVRRVSAASAASMAGNSLRKTGPALSLGLGGIGAGLKGVASGLGRFLMGPWGLGIMAISMFLPSIISGISSLVSSNKDNTSAVQSATELERQKLAEERAKNKGLTNEEQLVLMVKSLQDLTASLKSNKPMYTVVVNMDGKEVIKKVVQDVITEETVNSTGK